MIQKFYAVIGILYVFAAAGCATTKIVKTDPITVNTPDGRVTFYNTIEQLSTKVDEPYDEDPEQMRVRGDKVFYTWRRYHLHDNGDRWVMKTTSAEITLGRGSAIPEENPLTVSVMDGELRMALPTNLILRKINWLLSQPSSSQSAYFCGPRPAPIMARSDVRPDMARALSRDGYVKFADAYQAWKEIHRIQKLRYCSNAHPKKGKPWIEWVNVMTRLRVDLSKP